MFHKRFVEELFKPQPLYSKKALRTVFDRLAHASIMRLNAASMDKVMKIYEKDYLKFILINCRNFLGEGILLSMTCLSLNEKVLKNDSVEI